jgi:hypothetical protein
MTSWSMTAWEVAWTMAWMTRWTLTRPKRRISKTGIKLREALLSYIRVALPVFFSKGWQQQEQDEIEGASTRRNTFYQCISTA